VALAEKPPIVRKCGCFGCFVGGGGLRFEICARGVVGGGLTA